MTRLPSVLTLIRALLAVPLALAILGTHLTAALFVIGVACLTDVLDGWVARRYRATSNLGAIFDVTADIVVVLAGLGALVVQGVYPPWLFWLVVVMALQFVATARFGVLVYDPVGKYFGAALFGVLVLTVLLPDLAVWGALAVATVLLTLVSIASRVVFFLAGSRLSHR